MSNMRVRRRRRKGVTYIEVIVASLILAISLCAMASMWYFSFNMSGNTDSKGVAYAIGRHALEEVKETGFRYAAEGTTTLYYDSSGGSESTTKQSNSAYQVTVVVTSDKLSTSDSGSSVPADDALRSVVVTVTLLVNQGSTTSGTAVYTTGTYMARSGV